MRPAITTAMRAAATLCVASLLAGCAAPVPPSAPPPPSVAPTPSPEPTSGGGAPSSGPAALGDLAVTLEQVARGFEAPLYVTDANDGSGRLFVVEQEGRVKVVRDGRVSAKAFLDVSDRVDAGGERGLLGLAFSPDYRQSGAFYVNYTDVNGDTTVARFIADDPASDAPRLTGPAIVLKIRQPYSNHNGGCVVFEPNTERMWVGMGDGGAAGDPHGNAQNPRALLGKMLVLDFARGARPRPEIVQTGVRNPWRFSFDRETHDLWIGDVGQNAWEEIDVVPLADAAGVDWGWNLWEGSHPYPQGADPSKTGFRFPITEYNHESGQSVTGGYVYRGKRYPALVGTYFFGDFEAGWIAALRREAPDGTALAKPEVRTVLPDPGISPSSFGEDAAGELYVCDYGGALYRIAGEAK